MTKQEVNKLLALMRANYSYAFKSMSKQDKILLLNTWAFTLQDMDAGVVMIAVMQLISTSKWLPTVAEIREKCQSLHYEACLQLGCIDLCEMPEGKRAALEAISGKTCHIRGDKPAELSLNAILDNPRIASMAAGNRNIELLDSAGDDWANECEDEESGEG